MTKIKTYLGFAIKSGAVIYGVDNIEKTRKRPQLILIDTTISENSCNKLVNYLKKAAVQTYKIENLSELMSRTNILAVAVTNKDLAAAIVTECKKENLNEYGKSE